MPGSTLAFDSVVTAPFNFPQDAQKRLGKFNDKDGGACDSHKISIVIVTVPFSDSVVMCLTPAGTKLVYSCGYQRNGSSNNGEARNECRPYARHR